MNHRNDPNEISRRAPLFLNIYARELDYCLPTSDFYALLECFPEIVNAVTTPPNAKAAPIAITALNPDKNDSSIARRMKSRVIGSRSSEITMAASFVR